MSLVAALRAEDVDPIQVAEQPDVLQRFRAVSLEMLGPAAHSSRFDTKYVFSDALLPALLAGCTAAYQVLEVDGRRRFRYHTEYFDTADLRSYHAHHGGRANRHKVRVRCYLDSGQRYLEIKTKTNKERTHKIRIALRAGEAALEPLRSGQLSGLGERVRAAELVPVVTVEYTRLTLVRSEAAERVTIDTDLVFSAGGHRIGYAGVAIAEVKQHDHARSPVRELMRERRIRSGSLSKYCLGVMALQPAVKRNRFKHALAAIEKIGRPMHAYHAGTDHHG